MNSDNALTFDIKVAFKNRTALPAVSWSAWLDEAAIAEKRADLVTEKVSPHFHKRVTCINQSRSKARKKTENGELGKN